MSRLFERLELLEDVSILATILKYRQDTTRWFRQRELASAAVLASLDGPVILTRITSSVGIAMYLG